MVISAVAILSLIVTEFTYIAQVNKRIAYDSLDQVKAHYLAKSGLKLSLLRLKAYDQINKLVGSSKAGSGIPSVPRSMLDKIWSFPFFFPIPTNLPGMSQGDKDKIAKFQNASNFDGKYSAVIQSESGKYNLNLILAQFNPKPAPSPSPSPSAPGAIPPVTPGTTAGSGVFDPAKARESLTEYLSQILNNKNQDDPDFAAGYRDFRIEEFMDAVFSWADNTYEKRNSSGKEQIKMKKAPFYSVSELHMLPLIDDQLYELFTPGLTAATTPGINVNTITEATLRAIVPQMTVEETKKFFTDRDNEEEDNSFKDAEGFYKYLLTNVGSFRGSQVAIDQLKKSLAERHIQIVTEETQFKVTVQAVVNQSTCLTEAWVTLGATNQTGTPNPSSSAKAQAPGAPPAPSVPGGANSVADPGLKITFMRIL